MNGRTSEHEQTQEVNNRTAMRSPALEGAKKLPIMSPYTWEQGVKQMSTLYGSLNSPRTAATRYADAGPRGTVRGWRRCCHYYAGG